MFENNLSWFYKALKFTNRPNIATTCGSICGLRWRYYVPKRSLDLNLFLAHCHFILCVYHNRFELWTSTFTQNRLQADTDGFKGFKLILFAKNSSINHGLHKKTANTSQRLVVRTVGSQQRTTYLSSDMSNKQSDSTNKNIREFR